MQKPSSPYLCTTSMASYVLNGKVFTFPVRRISRAA